MVSEVESLPALALQLGERKRIGVDGTDGVRKTCASAAFAETLGIPLVSLDDYLIKNQGGYVQFLRYDELDNALRQSDRFIVEGVCLLQVLERVAVSVDAHVYVKRYRHNLWADERELDIAPEDVDDFLAQERKFVAMLSGLSGEPAESEDTDPTLADEIVRYHATYRPHEHADYVYRWNDG